MGLVIQQFPDQFGKALGQQHPELPSGPFRAVYVVGMGGSASPVDIVNAAFAKQLTVPLSIIKHYELPAGLTDEDLIIACSFSGNTEETLEAIENFPEAAANLVCLTAGGQLESRARERRYHIVTMQVQGEPDGFQPRSAVGYFVTHLARVLVQTGAMTDLGELAGIPEFLGKLDLAIDAEQLARWLVDKIPVVYTDAPLELALARSAKIKFNENSKRPSFFYAFPEVNHNEMMGFMHSGSRFGIVYFHDPSSHSRIRQRYMVMRKVMADAGLDHVEFREWQLPGESTLQKIMAGLAFAETCSFYLAMFDGVDPTPVDMVEAFKSALG